MSSSTRLHVLSEGVVASYIRDLSARPPSREPQDRVRQAAGARDRLARRRGEHRPDRALPDRVRVM